MPNELFGKTKKEVQYWKKKAGTLDKQLGIIKAAIIKVNEKVLLIKVIDKQINAFKKYRQSLDAIMTSKDFLCEWKWSSQWCALLRQ